MMQWDGAGEMKGTEREREKEMGRAERREHELRDLSRPRKLLPCMYEYESCVSVDRQCNAGSKYELQGRSQWRTCIDLFAKTGSWAWAWDRGRDVGMH